MTIERTSVYSGPYIANGVTTAFPFTFQTASADEVMVQVAGVTVSASDFTVSLNGDGTGSVIFFVAPPSGQVFIYSDVLFTQEVNFENQGPFYQASINEPIDRSALRDLWLRERVRSVSSPELLFPTNRAGKYLAWDAYGTPYATFGTGADGALRSDLAAADGVLKVNGAIAVRAAISSIANLAPTAGSAKLNVDGRRGDFYWLSGNQTAAVSSDPLQGLYIAPDFDPLGGSGCWAREWDGINGRPEWFYSGSWADAIEACVRLCPVTRLQRADYFTDRTIKINTPYRTLQGSGLSDGLDVGTGTRILCLNASASVLQVGPDTRPATVPGYLRNVNIRSISLSHPITLTAPADRINATKTLVATYLLDCEFDRVYCWEPLVGFFIYGAVGTYFKRCKSFRSVARAGADFCYGFWSFGEPAIPGLNGGSGSVNFQDCLLECGGGLSITRIGLYMKGAAADTFIDRFETTAATNGLFYQGVTGGNYGMQDIFIRDCVFDQCAGAAVDISGLDAQAAISIEGGYFQSKTTSGAVIKTSGSGTVSISGSAQVAGGEEGATIGIYGNNQRNLIVGENVIINDVPTPVFLDGDYSGAKILCDIQNALIGNGARFAVSANGTGKNWVIRPRISGKSGCFAQLIYLIGSGHDKGSIDPTGADIFATTAPTKVAIGSAGISAPGYYAPSQPTSTPVTTTAGSGIYVTGITT